MVQTFRPRVSLVSNALLALLLWWPVVAGAQSSERRIALVIGNANYKYASQLENAANDARAVASGLRGLGFEVVEAVDQSRAALVRQLRELGTSSSKADLVFLFYAGHAVQVDQENWLLPIDARPRVKGDLEKEAISFTSLINATLPASTRIIVIDACRDDPFKEGFLGTGGQYDAANGLARPNLTDSGTLVAFATASGTVAYDGSNRTDRNSPFTRALAGSMRTAGLEVRQLFTKVRREVLEATQTRQLPEEYSTLLSDVFLAGPPDARAAERDMEMTLWKSIERSSIAADFSTFLQRYPESAFAPLAKSRLQVLQRRAPGDLVVQRDCPECPEMVLLPAGTFLMGAPIDDPERNDAELPAHRVVVQPFLMGRYPVTFDEWDRCVADKVCAQRSSDEGWGRGRRPVINVSWEDAQRFAAWLTKKTGKKYRLPTEAEWEYAARAGGESSRYWGDDAARACRYANVYDTTAKRSLRALWLAHNCSDGYAQTSPVGSFEPNSFGLSDIIGNVWQWVADCWTDNYARASGNAKPHDPGGCSERVLRGGSFMSQPANARVTSRLRNDGDDSDITMGFRIARDAR